MNQSIDESKIIHLVKKTGGGTPHQIYKYYTFKYGEVNVESFTRKIRSMFANGKLNRFGTEYFLNDSIDTTAQQKTLKIFKRRL